MRIATWNINGIRARIEYVKLWIAAREPDLVGFQEIKAEDAVFPGEEFENLGYVVHTHGQKSWNGVALISKENIEITQVGLPDREENGARLIACDAGEISYATVYCPNGKSVDHADFQMKLDWFGSLRDFCAGQLERGRDFLIGGDYNICERPIDSHRGADGDGAIFHTTEEREVLGDLLNLGLKDLYRTKYPDSDAYSWWDYRAGGFQRNHGLRIDLLLGTQGVLDRVEDVTIDREFRKKLEGLTASDHAPVFVDLKV